MYILLISHMNEWNELQKTQIDEELSVFISFWEFYL